MSDKEEVLSGYIVKDGAIDFKSEEFNDLATAVLSDRGWICPHCGYKQDLESSEIYGWENNKLLQGQNIREYCMKCQGTYFVRARITLKLFSSKEKISDEF